MTDFFNRFSDISPQLPPKLSPPLRSLQRPTPKLEAHTRISFGGFPYHLCLLPLEGEVMGGNANAFFLCGFSFFDFCKICGLFAIFCVFFCVFLGGSIMPPPPPLVVWNRVLPPCPSSQGEAEMEVSELVAPPPSEVHAPPVPGTPTRLSWRGRPPPPWAGWEVGWADTQGYPRPSNNPPGIFLLAQNPGRGGGAHIFPIFFAVFGTRQGQLRCAFFAPQSQKIRTYDPPLLFSIANF